MTNEHIGKYFILSIIKELSVRCAKDTATHPLECLKLGCINSSASSGRGVKHWESYRLRLGKQTVQVLWKTP